MADPIARQAGWKPAFPGSRSRCRRSSSAPSSAFFALGGQHYLTLESIKANRDALLRLPRRISPPRSRSRSSSTWVRPRSACPGGLVLSLTMGFIFGRWVGTAIVVVAATVGATILFLAARYIFADAAAQAPGNDRREDQRRVHRERVQLHAVLAPGARLSVLSRELGAGFHVHTVAHLRAGDAYRDHSRDFRVREPGRDARPHRLAAGLGVVADAAARSRCWGCSR